MIDKFTNYLTVVIAGSSISHFCGCVRGKWRHGKLHLENAFLQPTIMGMVLLVLGGAAIYVGMLFALLDAFLR